MKTLIRLRRTDNTWAYVKSVSWGTGDSVNKIHLTADRSQAFGFSVAMAQSIATQYPHRHVVLERQDGAVSEGQAFVETANAASRQRRADEARQFDEAMRPITQEIARIIGRLR